MGRKPSSVHPTAEREVEHEARFYERRAHGLGLKFLDAFDVALERACARPGAGSVVATIKGEVVRAIGLNKFPFRLLFVERAEVIRVVAVPHDRRRPLYWAKRLSS